jgi:N-hydroxyarylamine O-acetyltransferase
MINLNSYFARIGYSGPRTATLSTLRALHTLHPAAIPFENLDPLLGRPVPLNLDALQAKMVGSRRGGYCFEQNTLLKAVLEGLGFSVTGPAARVVWMTPPDRQPNPRAHMVLKVDTDDGAYIADVGFGGFLIAAPVKLAAGIEQQTPAGMLRLAETDDFVTLQAQLGSSWQDVYRFTLEPQFAIDYEVVNWFTSAHPNSRFRNNMLIERLTPEVRTSLFNKRRTRRHADGRVEETILSTPDELAHSLNAEFNIEPPTDAVTLFARLPQP